MQSYKKQREWISITLSIGAILVSLYAIAEGDSSNERQIASNAIIAFREGFLKIASRFPAEKLQVENLQLSSLTKEEVDALFTYWRHTVSEFNFFFMSDSRYNRAIWKEKYEEVIYQELLRPVRAHSLCTMLKNGDVLGGNQKEFEKEMSLLFERGHSQSWNQYKTQGCRSVQEIGQRRLSFPAKSSHKSAPNQRVSRHSLHPADDD